MHEQNENASEIETIKKQLKKVWTKKYNNWIEKFTRDSKTSNRRKNQQTWRQITLNRQMEEGKNGLKSEKDT